MSFDSDGLVHMANMKISGIYHSFRFFCNNGFINQIEIVREDGHKSNLCTNETILKSMGRSSEFQPIVDHVKRMLND